VRRRKTRRAGENIEFYAFLYIGWPPSAIPQQTGVRRAASEEIRVDKTA